MSDFYYEPPEPTHWEQDMFDRVSDRHPEWSDQRVWDEVDRLIEDAQESAAEARAERMREDW
jgi:hypothetical protein